MMLWLLRIYFNYMLVIWDLFKDKLNMIFKWFDCLEKGKEEEGFIIEELCRNF